MKRYERGTTWSLCKKEKHFPPLRIQFSSFLTKRTKSDRANDQSVRTHMGILLGTV